MYRSLFISNFKKITIPLSLLSLFFLAEGVLRLSIKYSTKEDFSIISNNLSISQTTIVTKYPEKTLGWKMRANLVGTYKGKSFTTNNYGFRDGPWSLKREKGKKRIAVVGRSYAMGTAVSQGSSWPDQLESMLTDTEVLNFSTEGYSFLQTEFLINRIVFNFNPDIIILPIFYEEMNLRMPLNPKEISPLHKQVLSMKWWFQIFYLPQFLEYLNWKYIKHPILSDWDRLKRIKTKKVNGISFSIVFQRLIKEILDRNIKIVLFPMPRVEKPSPALRKSGQMRLSFYERKFPKEVRIVSGIEELHTSFSYDNAAIIGDPHPNKDIHKKLAELIQESIFEF